MVPRSVASKHRTGYARLPAESEDALVSPEAALLVNFLVGAFLLVVATSGRLGRWLSRHSVGLVALAALPFLTAVLLIVYVFGEDS